MSLHDAFARTTPFELAFPEPEAAEALAGESREEAERLGVDADVPATFLTLASVTRYLRAIRGPDAPPESVHQYGMLLYHGVAWARAGRPLWLLSLVAARALVGAAPGADPSVPAAAGYLQLPQHLLWASGADAPESVDGIAWTIGPGDLLYSMLALGIRPDRAGLAVTPLPDAPLADAPAWLDADVREDGGDFGSALPGAELDGLYGLRFAGEALKLLARFFAQLSAAPSSAATVAEPHAAAAGGPAASAFPYRRVTI